MTLHLEIPSELELCVRRAAEARGVSESEFIVSSVAGQLAGESAGHAAISPAESSLLREIDRGFSDEWWKNYRMLIARRDAGALTAEEKPELAALTDTLEEYNVRRISCITEVASLRGVRVSVLMDQLGLRPRAID